MTRTNRINPRYLDWRYMVGMGWSGSQAFAMLRALNFGASVAEARRLAEVAS